MPSPESQRTIRRNIVGERVRESRQQFVPPLTQDQLSGRLAAEGVQLDRVAIAKVESGLRSVFDYEVRGLASALGVDVAWLLGISAKSGSARREPAPRKGRR